MAQAPAAEIMRHLHRLLQTETADLADAQLLRSFASIRDEACFATLVRRHGHLVLGVARRVLANVHDAEDVFQATFLVLARKAHSIRKQEALASWLYGVAHRLAMKVRKQAARRREIEKSLLPTPNGEPPMAGNLRELQAVLEDEVARLPTKYRMSFVLCCLEGKSREEVARELGWKKGTLASRLDQARKLLASRLSRRGVTLAAALTATELVGGASAAAMSDVMVESTLQAAIAFAGGHATGAASAQATSLAMGMLKSRILIGLVLTLALSLIAAGAVWAALHAMESPGDHHVAITLEQPPVHEKQPARTKTDKQGDPLPGEALARLGTLRQRAPGAHVAVSADGKSIITAGDDLTVRVWDAVTGNLRSVKQLPDAGSYRTCLSPKGKYLLSTSHTQDKRRLLVWDLAAVKLAHFLDLSRTDMLEGVAFSADEGQVAIAETTNFRKHYIRVWNLNTGNLRTLHQYDREYTRFYFDPVVQFTPDSRKLVAVQRDDKTRCWDVTTDKLLWEIVDRHIGSQFYCFTSDSKAIISGHTKLDVDTGKILPWTPPPKEAQIPLRCSPDGRLVAFLTYHGSIQLCEIATGKLVTEVPRPARTRTGLFIPNRTPTDFAFLPDDQGFVWRPDLLQRWNLSGGEPLYPDTRAWGHTEAVSKLLFSADGKLLASLAPREERARLWDVASARSIHTIAATMCDQLAFLPGGDGLLVPTSSDKAVLRLVDATTGQIQRDFTLADRKELMMSSGNKELCVSADGKNILMLTFKNGRRGNESMLTIWDAASGQSLRHERVPWAEDSVITPDGMHVVACDASRLMLLPLDTAKPRWRLALDGPGASEFFHGCDLSLSLDGRLVAARPRFFRQGVGARNGKLVVVDVAKGKLLTSVPATGAAVFAFSTDNRLLAVADMTGIHFWEVAAGQKVGVLPPPHPEALPPEHACASALAFAPDGRMLATGHADSTILLWDTTFRGYKGSKVVTDAERASLWQDLAGDNAVLAQTAFWRLVEDANPSVGLVAQHIKPVRPVPLATFQPLLLDLRSEQFKVRSAADQHLRELGVRAEPALRAALNSDLPLETARRVEAILTALETSGPLRGKALRQMRAVQLLERIASAGAKKVLAEISEGVGAAPLTRAAREALERMK